MPGLFITFEGTEGAGKSTLIRTLAADLEKQGLRVTQTREPGGSSVAEKIRSLILQEPMDPWTELFLYEASRAEHLARTVRPALDSNQVVLCDRYADSSLAYQGSARGLPWAKVELANRLATQGLQPDLTVLLDVDPEMALARAKDPNRFEREGVEFQIKVRQGFLKAAKKNPKRWLRIQVGKLSPEELSTRVLKRLEKDFAKRLARLARD